MHAFTPQPAPQPARRSAGPLRRLGIAGLACLPGFALAAPLDPGAVSADAAWVFHVDLEAMRQGPMGRALLTDNSLGARGLLEQFGRDFGLRPDEDLLDITLYAPPGDRSRGIALLHATQAADATPQVLRERLGEGLTTTPSQPTPEYTWTMDGQAWHMTMRPRRADTRVVVLAESTQALRDASAVLDGSRPSLRQAREAAAAASATPDQAQVQSPQAVSPAPAWPMLESTPDGAMIVALVTRDAWQGPGDQPRAMVLSGSRGLLLTVREEASQPPADGDNPQASPQDGPQAKEEPQVSGELRIRMESGDLAQGMVHILQGMVATVRLSEAQQRQQGAGDPEVGELLRDVAIRAEGDDAILSLRAASQQMIRTLQNRVQMERRMRQRPSPLPEGTDDR